MKRTIWQNAQWIWFSGGKYERSSKYIDLTIMSDVPLEDKVMQEEIFGPILPIINVNSAQEAIDFINSRYEKTWK